MKKLHLQETKHAQNFSSTLCVLFSNVDSWKCFWWEQISLKEGRKKEGFTVVSYGLGVLKAYPISVKTEVLKLFIC